MSTPTPSSRQHRSPAEIIVHGVRLYYRFPLRHRGVEELLCERGSVVSYQTLRRWCHTFGPVIAAALRRRRPKPKDKWHLDEMHLKMNGKTSSRWRAVDADGMVLDILVQERRNQEAAVTFLQRLVEGSPDERRVVVTDTLGSYGPALKHVLPRTEHRKHQGLNHRAENSHQPTRQRCACPGDGFSRQDKHSASSSRSVLSASTSVPVATVCLPPPIALLCAIDSRVGVQ